MLASAGTRATRIPPGLAPGCRDIGQTEPSRLLPRSRHPRPGRGHPAEPGRLRACRARTRQGEGGRPRSYPDYMYLVYEALISVYGSARQVEAELAHRAVW